ncbi:MAG: DUF502 domain-containing protein [Elusimicrobia bacterium]|nr:DUF502 domain-containing protein [Elusimicrobiota bacterium]MDE2424848.1 DUF502 domain-containing protein [Elusimicrobiota bacterium]
MTPSLWRRFKRTMLAGLFILAPVSLSLLFLAWLVSLVDGLLAPLIGLLGHPVPGLGVVVALALVLAAGILGSNFIGRHLLEAVEDVLLKIPVFNWVYRTVKQLSTVFSPAGRARFKSVVLIEYPRPGVYSLGFVTNKLSARRDGKELELVSVYVPTNHMYIGDVVLVPPQALIETALSQQDGVQAIISAGAALPPSLSR